MRWQKLVGVGVLLASTTSHADPVCIIGRTDCTSIVLAESSFGVSYRIAGTPSGDKPPEDIYFSGEVGALVNLDEVRGGVGLTAGLTWLNNTDTAFIVRGRYRYWLSRRKSLDASLAYVGGGDDRTHVIRAELAAQAADQIGLVIGMDIGNTRFSDGGIAAIAIAVRFGGFIGAPVAALAYLVGSVGNG